MESSVEPVIWPGGQLVQLSTSGFVFFSSVGRVSRSSPPSQTKRHARELATYSFITWVVLDTTIFIHTYIIVIMRMEVISCFYLCSLIQFQLVGGATSFMAAGPGFWQCCAHWICAFFFKKRNPSHIFCLASGVGLLAAALPLCLQRGCRANLHLSFLFNARDREVILSFEVYAASGVGTKCHRVWVKSCRGASNKRKKIQLTTVLTVVKLCEIALIYEDFCTDSLWN